MYGAMPSSVPPPVSGRCRRPAPAGAPGSGPAVPLPRRQVLGVLAAGAAAVLAGCRRGTATGTGTPSGTPATTPAGPDPLLADLADELRLLSVYDATLRAHPTLAGRLRPLRANHAEHVTAL